MSQGPDVVRVITRLNIGGPAIQALLLTRALADRWPTMLLAGAAGETEGELSDRRVPVHRVPLVRPVHPVKDVSAIRIVTDLLRATKPRVVHTHMAKAGFVGRIAARRADLTIRTVHTFHGHVLEGYFPPPMQRSFIAIERMLAKRTDVLVAVSGRVRDDLMALGIGTPKQWRVIHLGFDLGPFLAAPGRSSSFRRELGIPENVHLIGSVGRLAPVKDHHLLLDAVARLDGVHLALVGDGELRTRLVERADRPDLRGRVHFVGWRRDIPHVLSNLDAVVLTSINEGTPVSLIEALAAARPVVATDVGGVSDVVQADQTGLLVRSRDPAEVARCIQASLDDEVSALRRAEEGRRRVAARFSSARLIRDIDDLYQDLVARGG